MSKFIDLSGQRYGKLVVIERTDDRRTEGGQSIIHWTCLCDCGVIKAIRGTSLKIGRTSSCGCLHKELASEARTTHGKSKKRVYRIYHHMKERCYSPKDKRFSDYGGRGIAICREWKDSFESFYSWAMDNGYQDDLSIDRIDNDGNYEPSNCRWVTSIEQGRNKRTTRNLTLNGETKALSGWAEQYGIPPGRLWGRLRAGWKLEDALTKPIK